MSRNRVEKRPHALGDLADIAIYLAGESGRDELAFRFLDAAEDCFESLAATPEMGAARTYNDAALVDVRMWRVTGFPNYLVFYRPIESGIEILRIIHASEISKRCSVAETETSRTSTAVRLNAELLRRRRVLLNSQAQFRRQEKRGWEAIAATQPLVGLRFPRDYGQVVVRRGDPLLSVP